MLKAKNILRQGLGFGTLSILLQGLVIIAVEVPQPYIWLEGAGALPSFSGKKVETAERVSAYVKLGSTAFGALLSRPEVAAAANIAVLGSDLVLKEAKVTARAGTTVLLFGIAAEVAHGRITALGKHDLSDEELVAMLLELLDEQ